MEADQPLMAAGLDSLGSMEFVSVLSERLRLPLPATLPFNYPTAAAIAEHLCKLLAPAPADRSSAVKNRAIVPIPLLPAATVWEGRRGDGGLRHDQIVCITAAVSQPLNQQGISSVAAALHGGIAGDAIRTVPHQRWDMDASAAARAASAAGAAAAARFGAFMADVEVFDASAFGMSAPEAMGADPQHRLLLQLTGEQHTPSNASHCNHGAYKGSIARGVKGMRLQKGFV